MLDIDFEKTVLTDEEKLVLKELRAGKLLQVNSDKKKSISALKSLNFVNYYLADEHGTRSAVSDLLHAEITDDGERYLVYIEDTEKRSLDDQKKDAEKEKRQFRHDWKIAIYSSVVGALLSRPIWDGIDWIAKLITSLLSK